MHMFQSELPFLKHSCFKSTISKHDIVTYSVANGYLNLWQKMTVYPDNIVIKHSSKTFKSNYIIHKTIQFKKSKIYIYSNPSHHTDILTGELISGRHFMIPTT